MAQAPTLTPPADGSGMDAGIRAWRQWHARCALLKCEPDSAAVLRRFAGIRAAGIVRRAGAVLSVAPVFEPDSAFHLFETHLLTHSTRSGKRYKEWLFARAGGARGAAYLDAVQGGATLVLRSAIRDALRAEAPRLKAVPFDSPLPGTNGLTMEDLLPSPASEAGPEADIEDLARREARDCFDDAAWRERFALCLRALDRSLDGPGVAAAARCGRSSLHAAHRAFVVALGERILRKYRAEAPGVAHAIARGALRRVGELALEWGKLDTSASRFFHSMGPRPARPRTRPTARRT